MALSASLCRIDQHSADGGADRSPIVGEAVIEPAKPNQQVKNVGVDFDRNDRQPIPHARTVHALPAGVAGLF
jgi:hypothetical protein